MKKTLLTIAVASILFPACTSRNKEKVSVMATVPEVQNEQAVSIPVKVFDINKASFFVVDDFHTDSTTYVHAYFAKDEKQTPSVFVTGYCFYGTVLGNKVYTALPGYGEVFFKLSDVHKVDDDLPNF